MASENHLAFSFALNSGCSERNSSENTNSSKDSGNLKTSNGLEPLINEDGTQSRPSYAELASRKAEEAASRRYQAAGWLREMVDGAMDLLPNEPSEEEFRIGLHNGLILCNVINKVNPGAVPKVVDYPAPSVPSPDGAALSAIQYFENVRNFLVAVEEMQLPTFEASDLEQGGSSTKVVDCILALKSYHDWKQTGGHGLLKYGVNLKFPDGRKLPIKPQTGLCSQGPGKNSDAASKSNQHLPRQWNLPGNDDTFIEESKFSAESNALLDFLSKKFPEALLAKEYVNKDLSMGCNGTDLYLYSVLIPIKNVVYVEETESFSKMNCFLEQHSSSQSLTKLVLAILSDKKTEEVPMLVESMLRKVMEEFERQLLVQGEQLKMAVKDMLKCEEEVFLKPEVLAALTKSPNLKTATIQANDAKQGILGISRGWYEKQFSVPSNGVDRYRSLDRKQQMRFDLQQREIEELKYTLHITREGVQMLQLEWKEELDNLEKHLQGLAQAAAGYHKVLDENRQLYNQVQDLKGSIRVYCRIRPFLPGQADGQTTVDFIGENGSLMIVNPAKQGKDARKTFTFNKVFGSSSTQEEIFSDTQPLIRSVLDGYNVCIFAYGQTGSGKTYTMVNSKAPDKDVDNVQAKCLRCNHWTVEKPTKMDVFMYQVGVQMIEIYNEQVRDLLITDGSNRRYPFPCHGIKIRNNSQQNGLNVPDANLVPVTSTVDVINLMNMGQKNRVVGATALNDRSSRSHRDLASGSILRGCLHLVDLAGSERVDKSEATGDRLKEAQHINKSLSALGDVIAALAQKNSHVPYRNSKLTQLLQDSLGGQAKTLMFVHISPEVDAYGETISTLKFAERVATVELGAARSNKESGEVRELKEQISNLKIALAKKDAEAEQLQSVRNSRSSTERQRMKLGVSPLRSQRQSRDGQAQSNRRQPMEEVGNIEVRSSSSGKQRKPGYGRDISPEEFGARSPVYNEEYDKFRKLIRRPSPERRSLSADRGNHTKTRIKHDMLEEQEVRKWQDKVMINKHLSIQNAVSQDDALRPWEACELARQDSISDMFYQRYHANPRKVYPDREYRQSLMEQNEGHGGIKRNRIDVKGKNDYQIRRIPRYEAATTDESEIDVDRRSKDDCRTSDFSEADLWQFKEPDIVEVALIQNVSRIKKPQQSSGRNPHHAERRSPIQAKSPSSASRLEGKLYSGSGQSKARTARQSVVGLPYGAVEAKRTSPGGKSAIEARVFSISPKGSSAKMTLHRQPIVARIGESSSKPSERWH
eukprot:Gb_16630 [translate_table: standard]